jgi:hypothetical protein
MYIKYPNRGEDICIGVFRDLEMTVGVCNGTDEYINHACYV